MTRKERILRMIGRLDDDASYDRVIYHLSVMKGIEIGLEEGERGKATEHDNLFERLLADDEKNSNRVVTPRRTKSAGNPTLHRQGQASSSSPLYQTAARRSEKTKKVP